MATTTTTNNATNPNPLPVALFDSLLPKLITVLEEIEKPDGVVTPQARQAVLAATNEFRDALTKAKELATNLPGGDLRIEEQVDVIEMLTELRDRKRRQLAEFSSRTMDAAGPTLNSSSSDSMMTL
ncbi:Mediator of RNA polymerase II transcription subunit 9 [Mycena kentingensis (nom. inval.)]|nr:Mediator of RNA polymerase II transcription subunit 9 [Mycena kentingensis (nom. inval.)]